MSKRTCLLVDDEENVSTTLRAILEREGYDVSVAPDGEAARDLIRGRAFEAAIIDLRLDGQDGLDVLRELRRRQPDCSAIMLTGYASLESPIRAIREGAYDYLVKPCDLEELKLAIARAVERTSLTRALQRRVAELEALNARYQELAAGLQRRVDRATADLQRKVEELNEAKRGLENANVLREQFISMVAHELSQPLTAINGFARLLGRSQVSPEVQEEARQTIIAEAARLGRLVQNLADVAGVAAGRFQVRVTDCRLDELVRDQVEVARKNSAEHRVELDELLPAITASCDGQRIAQVLSNLLMNALRHANVGKIRVRLRVEEDEALVSVSDEGPGIPREQVQAIFLPRVRLSPIEAQEQPGGRGLGLYIARGIVEAHGGRIEVESEESKGSTFTVRLPLKAAQDTSAQEQAVGRGAP